MIQFANDHSEGERRKADAMATLEANRELFILRGRRALLRACLATGIGTADDVRAAVELPTGIDPRCFGSVPGPLARAKIIRLASFPKSVRRQRHASRTGQWELIDAEAARRWLATHPEPPPDDDDECAGESAGSPVTPNQPTLFAAVRVY